MCVTPFCVQNWQINYKLGTQKRFFDPRAEYLYCWFNYLLVPEATVTRLIVSETPIFSPSDARTAPLKNSCSVSWVGRGIHFITSDSERKLYSMRIFEFSMTSGYRSCQSASSLGATFGKIRTPSYLACNFNIRSRVKPLTPIADSILLAEGFWAMAGGISMPIPLRVGVGIPVSVSGAAVTGTNPLHKGLGGAGLLLRLGFASSRQLALSACLASL